MTQGQPLFRALGPDGGEYLLVIEGAERWTILLDGALVAAGPTDDDAVRDAIARFRALPVATPRRVLCVGSGTCSAPTAHRPRCKAEAKRRPPAGVGGVSRCVRPAPSRIARSFSPPFPCSAGNLLRRLMDDRHFEQIVGLDVSHRALEIAAQRLHLDRMPERQKQRLQLVQGSLIYRDKRIAGFDAAAVMEVIEHLDELRPAAFERVLFEFAKPRTVVITTPNVEYNVRFESLPAGGMRHKDRGFEWTRQQFATGPPPSRNGSATACGSFRSGLKTRKSDRPRRWRSSALEVWSDWWGTRST